MFKVNLAFGGNPDHHEYAGLQYAVSASGESVKECADKVKAFIERHDLGAGNWYGGQVYENGVFIGSVSYNGKFWPKGHPYAKEA